MTDVDDKAERLIVYMETTDQWDAAKLREMTDAIWNAVYADKPFYVRWRARLRVYWRARWQTLLHYARRLLQ